MSRYRALAVLPVLLTLAACGPRGHSEAYLQACHGEPLVSAEAREEAMVEGYVIYPGYECITKESWAMVQAEKARRAAPPQAVVQREPEPTPAPESYEPFVPADVSPVDANTSSESELAQVISVGPEVAAQIVAARREKPFRDWDDLVRRVVGLSAALPAARASTSGLVVNGDSLAGAPPDAVIAAKIRDDFRDRE